MLCAYARDASLDPPGLSCAQVSGEVLQELCGQMGITEPQEVQEFALFLIKGEGEPGAPATVLSQERRLWAGTVFNFGMGPLRR